MGKRAPAVEASASWLVSPAHDLAFYSGLSVTGALLVLALGQVFEPSQLFLWFNLVLTVGHYAPTWMRAFLDKEELRTHQVSILGFPLLFAAVIFVTRGRPEVLAFIIYFWDRFHAVMQNYGFLRLYDAKAGARSRGYVELTLLFASAVLVMSFNMGLLAPMLNVLRTLAVPVPTTVGLVWGLRAVAGTVTLGALALYVRAQRGFAREGHFSLGKQVFLGALTGGYLVMNSTTNIFLLSAHEKLYHSVQYVVLVWHYNRRRVAQAAPADVTAPMRFLFRARGPWLYGLGVAAFVVLVAFLFQRFGLSTGGAGEGFAFTTVGSGVALTHYYFDSFLWRVRREQVRVNL